MKKSDIKGLLLYIPTTAYVFVFSFFMVNGFLYSKFPSLFSVLLYIGAPSETNISGILVPLLQYGILFEFVLISLFLYVITKFIFRKITPYKENYIFPALITMGYLLWALPIIIHTLPCDGRMCKFSALYPLSFFPSLISMAIPKMSTEIVSSISLILIVIIIHWTFSITYKKRNEQP